MTILFSQTKKRRIFDLTIWISTNGRPSNSAKDLASLPGFRRLRFGKLVKPSDIVVNWGSTNPLPVKAEILNQPVDVMFACNKLIAFQEMALNNCSTVDWTTDQAVAQGWSNDHTIVVRNKLTGHSGDGILIVEKGQTVPVAPLYTKYIYKAREWRVHVANSKVIDTQQKIRDPDKTPLTWKVRSHANGFIFARNGIEQSDQRDYLAIQAIYALGLDFGAVDIVEDKAGKFFVLEVNTAPGLEGQTLTSYQKAFESWLKFD